MDKHMMQISISHHTQEIVFEQIGWYIPLEQEMGLFKGTSLIFENEMLQNCIKSGKRYEAGIYSG